MIAWLTVKWWSEQLSTKGRAMGVGNMILLESLTEKNNPVWRFGEGVQNKSDFSCYPKQKKAVTNQVSVVK